MLGAIPPLPNTPKWHGAQLEHRDNCTFSLLPYSTSITAMRLEVLLHLCYCFRNMNSINVKFLGNLDMGMELMSMNVESKNAVCS